MDSYKQIHLINGDNIFTADDVSLEGEFVKVVGFMAVPTIALALFKMREDDPVAGAQQLSRREKHLFRIPRTSIVCVEELD